VTPPAEDSAHLSAETLADLDAGLLSAAEQAEAQRHLTACPTCRATRAALADVSAQLGAAAWRDPIPADVATRVEAALAREALAAREPVLEAGPQRGRRWIPRLVGAVAALSLIGGVAYVAGTARDGDQQGGGSTAESAAEAAAAEGAPPGAGSDLAASPGLADVAAATRELAASGQRPQAVPDVPAGAEQQGRQHFTATCGQPLAEALDRDLLATTPYTYAGRDAILVVVTGPSADLISGYVLPDCEADAADAYVTVDVPRE
jgi:hypothetical protein